MDLMHVVMEIRHRRMLLKAAGAGAAALVGAQATVIVSLAGLDWWKHRNRKARDAPRPGTFTAQVQESELDIYTSGETLYEDQLKAIDGARESIHMETYIWKNDDVGQRFLDALNAAAERGVAVYVIYEIGRAHV